MDRSEPLKARKRIAAIDLGTNSFHAIIVDIYPDGSFYIIDKLKEMVLLAEKGLGESLSEAAMDRGLKALKHIKTLCEHQGAERILAYATSAIREADNGGIFIQRAIDEIDIKINAISGRLEAELIGMAVQHGIKMPEEPALMMDVGGGSVEFMIGDANIFHHMVSKKIGVARMAAKFVDHDPITQKEIEALQHHFKDQLSDVAQAFAVNRASLLIGSSGTMENIAMMIASRKGEEPSISLNEMEFSSEDFFDLYDDMIGMDRAERSAIDVLEEKRIDIINPGLVLLNYVLKNFGIKKIKISTQALREGIILRYIKKEMEGLKEMDFIGDPRRRSVLELVYKCQWHENHSRHVANIALSIFDRLQENLKCSEEDRELLEYAAFMHDIGYLISHRKHHKHALYIIRNSDLLGFKEYEIEIMANVARYHRRSTPKKRHSVFNKLPSEIKERIRKLSGILRVADGLDRSHYQNVKGLELKVSSDEIKIYIETESDAELEIWGAMRKKTLFEEVANKELKIEEAVLPKLAME